MPESQERRQVARRRADLTGAISFGSDGTPCRVIDLSDNGAQIRIDGRRASRNFMGKRTVLTIDAEQRSFQGQVVWVRPAVNGVYLGLAFRS